MHNRANEKFPLFRKYVAVNIVSSHAVTTRSCNSLDTRSLDEIKYCCNRIKDNDGKHSDSVYVHILKRTDNVSVVRIVFVISFIRLYVRERKKEIYLFGIQSA